MTDIRKMLELAAKACGYEIDRENQHFRDESKYGHVGLYIKRVSTCWAPHVDDGDNSRMRTKLRIDALWVYAENGDAVGVECSVMRHHGDRFLRCGQGGLKCSPTTTTTATPPCACARFG